MTKNNSQSYRGLLLWLSAIGSVLVRSLRAVCYVTTAFVFWLTFFGQSYLALDCGKARYAMLGDYTVCLVVIDPEGQLTSAYTDYILGP